MHRTGPSCSKLLTTENRYGSKAVIVMQLKTHYCTLLSDQGCLAASIAVPEHLALQTKRCQYSLF